MSWYVFFNLPHLNKGLNLNTMKLTLKNNGWLAPSALPLSDFLESNEFLKDGNGNNANIPAVNLFENEEEYTIELGVPGMDKEDFSIKIDDGILTISVEKETETEDNMDGEYTYREYNYNTFSRSFTLPEDAMEDEIEASYEGGELFVYIPKATNVVLSGRHIEVV